MCVDIDFIIEKINQNRTTVLRLTTNGGKDYGLPPGSRAYHLDATDTFFLHGTTVDPADPFRASRSVMLAAVNVVSLEPLDQLGRGQASA